MKKIMKPSITWLLIALISVSFSIGQVLNKGAGAVPEGPSGLDERIEKHRKTTRDNLMPYRYESAKVAKFEHRRFDYIREVEIPLYSKNEYRFCLNAAEAKKDITIEVWNKPEGSPKRIKLLTKKISAGNEDIKFHSTELMEALQAEMKRRVEISQVLSPEEKQESLDRIQYASLKKVYIDFIVPPYDPGNEPKTYEEIKKEKLKGEALMQELEKNHSAVIMYIGFKNV